MNKRGFMLIDVLSSVGLFCPLLLGCMSLFLMVQKTTQQYSGISIQKQIELSIFMQRMLEESFVASECFTVRGKVSHVNKKIPWNYNLHHDPRRCYGYDDGEGPNEVWHSLLFFDVQGACSCIYRIAAKAVPKGIEYTCDRIKNDHVTDKIQFTIQGAWNFSNQDQVMPKMLYNEKQGIVTVILPTVFGLGSLVSPTPNLATQHYSPKGFLLKCREL